jgi:RecJ-like exonuclease
MLKTVIMKIKPDWMWCPDCDGKGCFEAISECCDSMRDEDTMLCYECHEHCEPQECQNCEGTGKVEFLADENGLR